LVTNQIVLHIGYDRESLLDSEISKAYSGIVTKDAYGRKKPKHGHGTVNLEEQTSSTKLIVAGVTKLFEEIANKDLLARRVSIAANNIVLESKLWEDEFFEQLDLFTDYEKLRKIRANKKARDQKEKKEQEAVLTIRKKYGKNAILRGLNFKEGSTGKDRNNQIGGHRA
jgi:DNA polymerase V